MPENAVVDVQSHVYQLQTIFSKKYDIDFYQREYVWQKSHLDDLINDLTSAFLRNWKSDHILEEVDKYAPYFMGEIIISETGDAKSYIIDGQQRITTLTLLLIYIYNKYRELEDLPEDLPRCIKSKPYRNVIFNLDIEERNECMNALLDHGDYSPTETDTPSVHAIAARYSEISDALDTKINPTNAAAFAHWLLKKVVFSQVRTNNDNFAYVIFETMNDRGLSLTQVEMLRSFLLANINKEKRVKATEKFDNIVRSLMNVKLSSKSKAEFEFFKVFFRGHYADNLSQERESQSDFLRIGKEFHRWVRDNTRALGLLSSNDYWNFLDKIVFFAKTYEKINDLMCSNRTQEFLYLIVNKDFGFTLQPALILAAINFNDSDSVIEKKIKITSKYITKMLAWRVWGHFSIAQSALEAKIYELCQKVRGKSAEDLETFFGSDPAELGHLTTATPSLNQQNKYKIRVLLALITEIIAKESGSPNYILKDKDIEVEHILSDHFEWHQDEYDNEFEYATARNGIGDLILLPKSFNGSYNDKPYEEKRDHYFEQNILAQTLCPQKYANNPGFLAYKERSGLAFKPYDKFTKGAIAERAELYRSVLEWNWNS